MYQKPKGLQSIMEANTDGEEGVNYHVIKSIRTNAERRRAIRMELSRQKYICLTDALMNRESGGNYVLEHLDGESIQGMDDVQTLPDGRQIAFQNRAKRRTWKIRAIKDSWGNPYKPGDLVTWTENKPYKDDLGRKVTGREVNAAIIRGEGDLYKKHQVLQVDAKGCIDCDYEQACTLLNNFGIHYKTGFAICGKREMTRDPSKAPDGTMKPIHYWRFAEVPPWEYGDDEEEAPAPKPKQKRQRRKAPAKAAVKPTTEYKSPSTYSVGGSKEDDNGDGQSN